MFPGTPVKTAFFYPDPFGDRDSGLSGPGRGLLTYVTQYEDGVDAVDGLNGAGALAFSPVGAHACVVGFMDDAITAFSRDADTGEPTFPDCNNTKSSCFSDKGI